MTDRLTGKVALVFGAGSSALDPDEDGWSNGMAAAVAFAREGAAVAAIDVSESAARMTADVIAAEGGQSIALTADVTDERAVADTVTAAMNELGSPDILHNNVGVAFPGDLSDLSLTDWRRALATNLDGAFLTCKHVLPHLLAAGRGAIVNVSSVAGIRYTGYPYPAYAAAKAGVNQLTVSLALRHAAEGIRVNAILPGLIDTPMVRQQLAGAHADPEAMLLERHAASPTGAMGTVWDVASAAVFLASDEAAYVNGVCLPVDGGLSARCG